MSAIAKYATAWSLTLAPVLLVIPAVLLAGIGPFAVAHIEVLVIAFLPFAGRKTAALPRLARAARRAGESSGSEDRHRDCGLPYWFSARGRNNALRLNTGPSAASASSCFIFHQRSQVIV